MVPPLHLEVVESTVATTHSGCNAILSHNLTATGNGCTFPGYLVENTIVTVHRGILESSLGEEGTAVAIPVTCDPLHIFGSGRGG